MKYLIEEFTSEELRKLYAEGYLKFTPKLKNEIGYPVRKSSVTKILKNDFSVSRIDYERVIHFLKSEANRAAKYAKEYAKMVTK